ncbi:MAG: GldG family protein [Chloroflexota bacterium]|nr:GldG family protein [Chloroflexota bacterium]
MSEQPTDTGGDWRRRGRRDRASRPEETEAPDQGGIEGEESEESELRSRTLFSFLEPSLNAIGSFGAPLVIAGIVAIVAGAVLVAFVSSMRLYGFVSLGFGVALLVLVGLISLSSVVAAFISRTGRYGVNSLIMLGAFLGIVIVANAVSFTNNARVDVTATNQYSLAQRTEQLLDNLDQDIEIIAFYKEEVSLGPQGNPDAAYQLLNRENKVVETFREFRAARPTRVETSLVDPDVNPQRVNQYFGTTPIAFVNESIVVRLKDGDAQNIIQPRDASYSHLEQDLVTSILLVTGLERKAIYFLSGHGERSVNNTGSDGYGEVRVGLEQDNYRVETLRWAANEQDVSVPDDAAILVIARPTNELPDAQAEVLHLYMQGKNPDGSDRQQAGRLVFLGEPDTPDTFRQLLALWGVILRNGYIYDEAASFPDNPGNLQFTVFDDTNMPPQLAFFINQQISDARSYQELWKALLGITAPKGRSLGQVTMPGTTALDIRHDGNPQRQLVPLAISSEASYLIDDLDRQEVRKGEAEDADPVGPFPLMVFHRSPGALVGDSGSPPSVLAENQIAQMFVIGDSDFLANSFYERGGGADLFLNSVNYLVGDHSLVSLRPKALTVREFNVDRNQENFVKFTSWLLLPGLMGLMAAMVWWVRR